MKIFELIFNFIDAILLLIKYSIPLLSLWLGYSAIQGEYDLYFFAKYVTRYSLIYALFLGGISAVFAPSLYFFLNKELTLQT